MFGFSTCKSCVESTFKSLLILAAGNAEVRSDKNTEEAIDRLGREQRLRNIVKPHVCLPIKKDLLWKPKTPAKNSLPCWIKRTPATV